MLKVRGLRESILKSTLPVETSSDGLYAWNYFHQGFPRDTDQPPFGLPECHTSKRTNAVGWPQVAELPTGGRFRELSFAKTWKWPEEEWSHHLVPLLLGQALEAFLAMDEQQAEVPIVSASGFRLSQLLNSLACESSSFESFKRVVWEISALKLYATETQGGIFFVNPNMLYFREMYVFSIMHGWNISVCAIKGI